MRVEVARKAYGEAVILRDFVLEVPAQESLALIGPSGIGKSTLLRIVAGLDAAYEGSVSGAGRIAIAFQEPTLMPWRCVRDNLTIPTRCTDAQADTLLAAVGLPNVGARFPNTLSLGQARRVALARAFAMQPDTLLLDEPFASLDREVSAKMQGLLLDLLRAHPARLIVVTHDPMEAARLADRVLHLDGTPAQIVRETRLSLPTSERSNAWVAEMASTL